MIAVASIVHNWAILVHDEVAEGRKYDVALDQECWDRAVEIYIGHGDPGSKREPSPRSVPVEAS